MMHSLVSMATVNIVRLLFQPSATLCLDVGAVLHAANHKTLTAAVDNVMNVNKIGR